MKSFILVILLLFSSVSYASDSVCYKRLDGPYNFEIVCINGYQYIAAGNALTQMFEKGYTNLSRPISCECKEEK